jgi:hypothetical protein
MEGSVSSEATGLARDQLLVILVAVAIARKTGNDRAPRIMLSVQAISRVIQYGSGSDLGKNSGER